MNATLLDSIAIWGYSVAMDESTQFRATGLHDTLRTQGRKARWLAEKAGVSESLLSHAMKGRRTVNATAANRIAELLGVPFFVLWELSDGDKSSPRVVAEEQAA